METKLRLTKTEIASMAGKLNALNPLAILSRGYAVASIDGRAVKAASEISPGASFKLRLSEGEIAAKRIDDREVD